MFSIPTPQTLAAKALIAGALAIGLLAAGAYGGYRFEKSRYDDLVTADAKAQTAAVKLALKKQGDIDAANQKDAVAQAYFKGKMDGTVITLKTEAPANVTIVQDQQAAATDHAGCITYGFYRLLAAGERGVTPDSLPLPSGQSVDACTGVEPSELATDTAQDLAAGHADAHQLNALINAVQRNDALLLGTTPPASVPSDVPQPEQVGGGDPDAGPPSGR